MVRMRFDSVKVAPAVDVEKGSASESARGTKQEQVQSKREERRQDGGARAQVHSSNRATEGAGKKESTRERASEL